MEVKKLSDFIKERNIEGRTDNMKSTAELFKNNELTAEAIKKMLETCDESAEYIKGNMIYCRKSTEPRRKKKSAIGA